jgi:hypothetical protein
MAELDRICPFRVHLSKKVQIRNLFLAMVFAGKSPAAGAEADCLPSLFHPTQCDHDDKLICSLTLLATEVLT